ncbi:methyltransferase domain-containing protein [Candidatus Woesebacteria bacterium]|nr:methyltransferase domain-containing protein [Candidatus Woesebacteria bacterium]
MQRSKPTGSWQQVTPWYNKLVGNDGHYYHQHVVLPGVLRLLQLQPEHSLVDLGCGQGILARQIPPIAEYLGLDVASSLIAEAQQGQLPATYTFKTANVARPLQPAEPRFTHAAIVLALQNMESAQVALQNAANFLVPGGTLVLVLNHPCFRIPRQSGWGSDEKTKQQYRWINRYLSPLKIPITMNPGQQQSAVTWSFHHSLQDYSQMLQEAGFVITKLEEWTSDKQSEGAAAKQENRARSEFPLFMAIKALIH